MNEKQIERYSRQLLLPGFSEQAQERLFRSRILILGTGGLGSPAAFYLAAAGVGTLVLADFDSVDLSNLGRQILHTTDSVGSPKVHSAAQRLQALNPSVNCELLEVRLDGKSLQSAIQGVDLVVEGSDNFDTKYAVNDSCVKAGKPFVLAGVVGFGGQVLACQPGHGPCYRCRFPSPPPGRGITCSDAGILGPVAGIAGSLLASQAIQLLTGMPGAFVDSMLDFDVAEGRFQVFSTPRDPSCSTCGGHHG